MSSDNSNVQACSAYELAAGSPHNVVHSYSVILTIAFITIAWHELLAKVVMQLWEKIFSQKSVFLISVPVITIICQLLCNRYIARGKTMIADLFFRLLVF